MIFRPSVTQLRILIVAANLLVTVLVAGLPIYRMMNPHSGIEESEFKKLTATKPSEFAITSTEGTRRGGGSMSRWVGMADSFKKPPPPPPPPPVVEDGPDEPPDTNPDDDVLPPGPLEEKWLFRGGIFSDTDSQDNTAYLVVKEDEKSPTTSRRSSRTPSRLRSRISTRSRRPPTRRGRTAEPQFQVVRVYDEWEVPDEDLVVWAISITEDEFVYEVDGSWERYALKREEDTLTEYDEELGLHKLVVPSPEEESEDGDETNEDPDSWKFFVKDKSPREEFDARKKTFDERSAKRTSDDSGSSRSPTSSTARSLRTSSSRATPSRSSSRSSTSRTRSVTPRTPTPPSAKDVEKLKGVMKRMPAKDANKIKEAMGGKAN